MKRHIIILVTFLLFCSFTENALSTLYDRGNGLIYDDVLNVTWMDEYLYYGFGEVGDAEWLINRLNVVGQGNTTVFNDGTVSHPEVTNKGFTDWRLPTIDEYQILGSQLSDDNPSPFTSLSYYDPGPNIGWWSSDFISYSNEWGSWEEYYVFNFTDDSIGLYNPISWDAPALAVRYGDVAAPIPEPASISLFSIGIAGFAVARRKRKNGIFHKCQKVVYTYL